MACINSLSGYSHYDNYFFLLKNILEIVLFLCLINPSTRTTIVDDFFCLKLVLSLFPSHSFIFFYPTTILWLCNFYWCRIKVGFRSILNKIIVQVSYKLFSYSSLLLNLIFVSPCTTDDVWPTTSCMMSQILLGIRLKRDVL